MVSPGPTDRGPNGPKREGLIRGLRLICRSIRIWGMRTPRRHSNRCAVTWRTILSPPRSPRSHATIVASQFRCLTTGKTGTLQDRPQPADPLTCSDPIDKCILPIEVIRNRIQVIRIGRVQRISTSAGSSSRNCDYTSFKIWRNYCIGDTSGIHQRS